MRTKPDQADFPADDMTIAIQVNTRWQRLRVEQKARASATQHRGGFLPFSVLPTFRFSIYSSAAFWKANLTGVSSAFLKLDRWIIMINATPLFMSIQT